LFGVTPLARLCLAGLRHRLVCGLGANFAATAKKDTDWPQQHGTDCEQYRDDDAPQGT
jgi:hypothetical protein